MGLIPVFQSGRHLEKGYCVFPQKDIRQLGGDVWCWAQAMQEGSCCTHWTFAAPFSKVMHVQGDQQTTYQTLLLLGREVSGGTEQRKHRRLRKAPYTPTFLFSGHLIATSVAHRIQWGGPTSCSGNKSVLEMLKVEEVQGQEFPLAIITLRQGNSSYLTSLPRCRTHHRALKSRGLCHCVRWTQKSGNQRHTGADP